MMIWDLLLKPMRMISGQHLAVVEGLGEVPVHWFQRVILHNLEHEVSFVFDITFVIYLIIMSYVSFA